MTGVQTCALPISQVTGEEAKQDIQVVDFLTQYPIHFVLFQGRNGLGVSKIYAKK